MITEITQNTQPSNNILLGELLWKLRCRKKDTFPEDSKNDPSNELKLFCKK